MIALHGKIDSKKVMSSAFITMFISLFMGTLISIRKLDKFIILLPFVCAWLSDTGAYFIGITFGKRRPWGEISPKKSVEGAIGGIVVTCIALYLLNMYFGLMHGATVILIGVAVAIIGLIGDLMESLIKRYYGVKDSDKLLPGHGGILDRFDSVMLAAPMMYYCILLARVFEQFAGLGVWFVF